ncbi:MAG: PD40 domain-containing protein [Parachlamydiaceae bacterium]|nr:PD40 domain-containing protein [Parachlamydiaceae bacterium]
MNFYLFILFFSLFSCRIWSDEIFDFSQEERFLKNITQLTFPSMGFEKAGEAYFSSDGENIAFQAVPQGEKHYQIYVMKLNQKQGTPYMVSTGKGACTCPYFHPDGNKIIFASSHEDPNLNSENKEASGYKRSNGEYSWDFTPYMNIYEANLDGTGLKALTRGSEYHAECAYSTDGSRIVFASNKDGAMNIFTIHAGGTNLQQVTFNDACYNGGPFFSPDGNQIIFRSDRQRRHYLQIYVINADGTHERQLTNNHSVNWAPYWHPSGKVIAFTTSLHGHMHYEIYGMNIESGACCRLTHHSNFDGLPAFTLDGQKMMWTSKRGADNTCQIFLADFFMPEELN